MNPRQNPSARNPAFGLGNSSVESGESSTIAHALPSQLELQLVARVQRKINFEFDRISASFRTAIDRQSSAEKSAELEVALAHFEAKRGAALSLEQLRYLLQDRDVVDEQTHRVIVNDVRYQAIKSIRTVRSEPIRASDSNAALGGDS